jgi:hypothetical protein
MLLLALLLASPVSAARKPVRILPGPKHVVKSRPAAPRIPGCLYGKSEWSAKGPKLLVEKALQQRLPIEVPDFRAKIGTKDTASRAQPYAAAVGEDALVSVEDKESHLFLSGVLGCDAEKRTTVLKSLTYLKGGRGGVVPLHHEQP